MLTFPAFLRSEPDGRRSLERENACCRRDDDVVPCLPCAESLMSSPVINSGANVARFRSFPAFLSVFVCVICNNKNSESNLLPTSIRHSNLTQRTKVSSFPRLTLSTHAPTDSNSLPLSLLTARISVEGE